MKLNADKILITVIALLLLAVGAVVTASFYQSEQVKQTAKLAMHTQDVLIASEKLLSLVTDNETGSRGYLLTGNKSFLDPLERSQKKIYNQLALLKTLTGDNPAQRGRTDSLSFYIDKRINFSNLTISAFESSGAKAAVAIVETGEGKIYTDRVRFLVDQIQATENVSLARHKEANEKKNGGLTRILVAVGVFIFLLVLFFIQNIRLEFVEKKKAAAALKKLNEELEEKVKARTEAIDRSEKKYRYLFENNPMPVWIIDLVTFKFLDVNEMAILQYGYSREEFLSLTALDIRPAEDKELFIQADHSFNINEENYNKGVWNHRKKDGTVIQAEIIAHQIIFEGTPARLVLSIDVTERIKAEKNTLKANRLYVFISQINQMIVRARNETTVFNEACRIAVDTGNFRMAWIGLIDEKTNRVIPVMHAGEDTGYLSKIQPISITDTPGGRGPTGTAIREGKYIICNDIENDPQMAPWAEVASGCGYGSSMALPIIKSGKVIGTFSFYARERNFFDAAEISLLEEATGDVAFALEIFEKEDLQKKAEAAVLESERRYQTLTEVSPVGIFHTDETGYTTYVNPRWCQITGLPAEKALGNGWLDAVHEEDKQMLLRGWEEATKIKTNSVSEYRFVRPDGSIAWVLGQAIAEKNVAGQIVGYVGTTTDISERKKAEQEILREKILSDKIINSLPGIFYLSDSTPRLLRWNKALEKISGYTEAEIEKMIPINLFHPEDHQVLRQGLERSRKNGEADVEVRLLTKTGQTIPFYFTGVGIEYEGKPAVMGIGIDISEHKKAAEEIEKVNQRFEMIARATSDAVFELDKLTGKNWHNDAFMKLFNTGGPGEYIDPDPVVWKSKIHPDDRERVIKKLDAAYAGTTAIWTDEFRFQKADNSYGIFYDRAYITRDETGKAIRVIGSMTDITELKRAEEEIKISNERFELIAKATNDIIWDWDLQTGEIWWNNSYYSVFGFDNNSPLDIDAWSKSLHPEDSKRVWDGLKKIIDSGANYWEDEYRCIKNNGSIIFIYDRGFVLHNEKGTPIRMIGSMLDFTERKKAEEAKKASEEKYRTLVEQASDAILIANAEGRFIKVNASACKLSQYSENELLTMTIYDFTIIEDIEKNPLHFDELKLGKTVMSERIIKGKEGIRLNVEITAKLLSDGRLLLFLRDIAERKKAQDEIIKERNLSDSIINSLPGVFYLYNKEGKFLRWNTNFEKVSGYSAAEIRNMHPLDFFDTDEKELISAAISNVFVHGEDNIQASFVTKAKDKIPYYFTGKAIEYEDSTCLMGVGIDFTERVRTQEEIKETSEQLRQLTAHLQKIREEERKRIGREIHDELGQQLTAIKMDVAWVNKKIPEETIELKSKLKNIIYLLDGSNQSIRRILSELRPSILDDYGLLEAVDWLGQQFTQNTGVPVIFISTETNLKLSEQLTTTIFRVYQEALTNITRYAHAHKVVTSLQIIDESVIFIIEDDGQGFNTTYAKPKKSFGILGMKERILLLHGKFDLVSSPGKGTKITIHIPVKM